MNFKGKIFKIITSVFATLVACISADSEIPLRKSSYNFLSANYPPFKEILNYNEFLSDAKMTPALTLVVFYSKDHCTNCPEIEQLLTEVYERYRHHIRFFKINCDNHYKDERIKINQCQDNYPNGLPDTYFFTPEDVTYFPYDPMTFRQNKLLVQKRDPEELDMHIYRYMPVFAKRISNMTDFNDFMENFGALSRVLYFSTSDEPPRYFKGLTSYFKDKLEFAYITKDAVDVYEYLNQTTKPRWVVLKRLGKVKFKRKNYLGKRDFDELKAFLGIYALGKGIDRRAVDYKKILRERMSHTGEALKAEKFDFLNFERNIDFEDDIVILHVTDTLSLDYPNLKILQSKFGGSLVRTVDLNANHLRKKKMVLERFPEMKKRPFIVVYPRGNLAFKKDNRRLFGPWDSLDALTLHISNLIGDKTTSTNEHSLVSFSQNAFLKGKGVMLLIYENSEHISMTYRLLARKANYTKDFIFLTMKNPNEGFLKNINVDRLPQIVFIKPDYNSDYESVDDIPELIPIRYAGRFRFEEIKEFFDAMAKTHVQYLKEVNEIKKMTDFDKLTEINASLDENFGEKSLIFIVDKKKDLRNEEWDERMLDMKRVAYSASEVTGGSVNYSRTGYLDVNCFGGEIEEFFRFDRKKDLPVVLSYRKVTGRKREGVFVRLKQKLTSFNGKDFFRKVVELEKRGGVRKAGYVPVRVNFWRNFCDGVEGELDL